MLSHKQSCHLICHLHLSNVDVLSNIVLYLADCYGRALKKAYQLCTGCSFVTQDKLYWPSNETKVFYLYEILVDSGTIKLLQISLEAIDHF